MKAAIYKQTGNAVDVLKIEDAETPTVNDTGLLVNVHASGINPSDIKRRSGEFQQPFPIETVIPHSDGAGVVEAVGKQANSDLIGKRVWIHNAQWLESRGTAAEYVVVDQSHVGLLPDNISFEEGATLGVPLLTAWNAIHASDMKHGDTVFIAGGAGAVGMFAIQLAKLKGVTVITTVSSEAKAKVAKQMGADHIINYKTENIVERTNEITLNKGVNAYVEVNLSANIDLISDLMANGGRVIVYGSNNPEITFKNIFAFMAKGCQIHTFIVYNLPKETLEMAKAELFDMLENKDIHIPIADIFPLAEIAKAHERVENGPIGNVIVTL